MRAGGSAGNGALVEPRSVSLRVPVVSSTLGLSPFSGEEKKRALERIGMPVSDGVCAPACGLKGRSLPGAAPNRPRAALAEDRDRERWGQRRIDVVWQVRIGKASDFVRWRSSPCSLVVSQRCIESEPGPENCVVSPKCDSILQSRPRSLGLSRGLRERS
jgi:hypothetical protein